MPQPHIQKADKIATPIPTKKLPPSNLLLRLPTQDDDTEQKRRHRHHIMPQQISSPSVKEGTAEACKKRHDSSTPAEQSNSRRFRGRRNPNYSIKNKNRRKQENNEKQKGSQQQMMMQTSHQTTMGTDAIIWGVSKTVKKKTKSKMRILV